MDTITHAFAGYVFAKTDLTGDTGRWGVIAGVSASLFPDADGLFASFYGKEFTLRYHRGLTNSILLVVPFSLFFAWLFVKISGKRRFPTCFVMRLLGFQRYYEQIAKLFEWKFTRRDLNALLNKIKTPLVASERLAA